MTRRQGVKCAARLAQRCSVVTSLATQQQADHAGAGADYGERSGGPEGEHAPGEAGLESCKALGELALEFGEPLPELRVEAREVRLIELPQLGTIGGVHGVEPVHKLVGHVLTQLLI